MAGAGTVVVTGATGGIGAAICRRLSADGYGIVAQYRDRSERAASLAAELVAAGGVCVPIAADLGTDEGVTGFGDAVESALADASTAPLVGLVNGAARMLGPSFHGATPALFDAYFALNTKAPFFLTQRLVPLMRDGGSIVNISSAGAHFSSPGDIVYAMSKAALESMTSNLAEALAEHGVRVNSVVPGFTDNGHPAFSTPAVRDYMSSFAVLGGVADPAAVAEAVVFLISGRSSRTTGSIVDVSGGSTLGARGRRAGSVSELIGPH
ncbi:MAG TPA: SDR family oxidoreductase [Plantibacter sp.]|uniref:SDR family NAD(P)-dependent oxidoreductase n=1 Tax=Plantibacter sp. TaxID=1871045 RepID=UPI002BE17B25|nr:SDR family oxidoreductase [Plantibacter sp.]